MSPPLPAQREYWRERQRRDGPPLLVEYGNDVDGSLFLGQDRLGASRWNLNVRGEGVGGRGHVCVCVEGASSWRAGALCPAALQGAALPACNGPAGQASRRGASRTLRRCITFTRDACLLLAWADPVMLWRRAAPPPPPPQSLPLEPGSALRHCGRPIPGVSTPMLYIGQLFSTL